MAFLKILVAVCLLAFVEGHFNYFPNFGGFGGYPPQISFMRPLPIPQPPRLPGFFQQPPLPQPPLLPMFGGNFGGFNYPGPVIDDFINEPFRRQPDKFFEPFEKIDFDRGGSFSGITVSSNNAGNNGVVTVVTTNENGETQTFISPSSPQGSSKFYRVLPKPSVPEPQVFELPEIRLPKPKFPKMPPIDLNAKPSKFNNFKAQVHGSTLHMSSKTGDKPKFVAETITYTNDNGKVDKKVSKYEI